ncbi:sulfite exporter TauE/SafE family protein [uncultured Bifidobacterium sp.]|uniref:sulfite exporter TauE/SafE family protein n=1 Tax=uncultured Bifidobacterium sp. TaxID=165187 RepID=UPI0028DB8D81|nr:sulfite exporter TauE/SafE family protein [uncultured Bifidobacterium sp.]
MVGLSVITLLLVFLAGIGAGFVGYAVGASSLVSYPAMLALGVPPVIANATNTVGVIGTGVGGVLGARQELRGQRTRAVVYVLVGCVGGVFGSLLLLGLDPRVFEYAVPPLILLSALAIALNPRGRSQTRQAVAQVVAQAQGLDRHTGAANRVDSTDAGKVSAPAGDANEPAVTEPIGKDPWWVWPAVAGVAVYSGYFGAGAGTVAIAALDAARIGPFHQINALKTIIGAGANVTASVVFVMRGVVDWPAAVMMAVGCFIGSYIAPPITRHVPARTMRILAVAAGVLLAVDLAVRTYW